MASDLLDLLDRLGHPRILVVGDLMLDRYIWGDAERISQEAPVALLRARRQEQRLGGAGSVCANLRALEAAVWCAGVVGDDAEGRTVVDELRRATVDTSAVVTDPSRPTTVKQRYIGRAQQRHPQQMLRVDYEQTDPIEDTVARRMLDALATHWGDFDIILVSDYDKGVCTPQVLSTAFEAARLHAVRCVVDPIRSTDYARYRGASCVTPNRQETQLATGLAIDDPRSAVEPGRRLCEALDLETAVVTLDRDGMLVVRRDGSHTHVPTRARQVYDITGAGDMVLSAVGLALACGADDVDAARLGNTAGGLEVEKIGVATVSRDEIRRDLLAEHAHAGDKLRALDDLLPELDHHRRSGHKIVFTNGCFDLLHAGHATYLRFAADQGDCLVLGLNSDASVHAIKGPSRPINNQQDRAAVLGALDAVDYVVLFDDPTPQALIEAVRPDVLVKGADWAEKGVVGREFVEANGGRVVLAPVVPGVSTSDIIKRIKAETGE